MTSLFNFLDYIKIIFGIFSHHIKSLRIWCLTVVIFFDVSCFCFSIFIKISILNFIIIFLPNPSNMFNFFFLISHDNIMQNLMRFNWLYI